MKYCNQCGAKLPAEASFCNHCGSSFPVNKASNAPYNKVQNTIAPGTTSRINTVMIILVCILSAVTITALVFLFIKVFPVNSNNANNSNQDFEVAFSQETNESSYENSLPESNDAGNNAQHLMPIPSQQIKENEEEQTSQKPASEVDETDFLTNGPAFSAGLQPNILEYLDGTAWISTGRIIENQEGIDEYNYTFPENEWMYTFNAVEGYVELYSLVHDDEFRWDFTKPDDTDYYIDTFFYYETIEGVDQVWNNRLFVVKGVLYDVLFLNGKPVSDYSVFERYEP